MKPTVERLRNSIESAYSKANAINTDVSGNWTPKRGRQADSRLAQKERILKYIKIAEHLITAWVSATIPTPLLPIKSVSDIEYLYNAYWPKEITDEHPSDGWYRKKYPELINKLKRYGIKNENSLLFVQSYLKKHGSNVMTPEELHNIELAKKINELRYAKIPGFFPTPDELIDIMISIANIHENDCILEPSAGIGNIVDRLKIKHPSNTVHCVERQYSLCEILTMKGHALVGDDIFTFTSDRLYDVILMNPPFENNQDIAHVVHCYNNFLSKNGTIVAIMSSGVLTNKSKQAVAFRDFLNSTQWDYRNNGAAFKGSFNSTGVSTIMISIYKK